jgi:predicted SAM-dependent methyltransferase
MKIFSKINNDPSSILNNNLYQKARSIPKKDLEELRAKYTKYAKLRGYGADYIKANYTHLYRYWFSFSWISKIINNDSTIFEMGGSGPFTDILMEEFPGLRILNISSDLRKPWDIESNCCDLVIGMEVVEHLSDIDDGGIQDAFKKTGLRFALNESYRILKNKGKLFLTTPNASSVCQLANVANNAHLHFFDLHVREYPISELRELVSKCGYKKIVSEAIHCLTIDTNIDWSLYFKMLLAGRFSTENRGDDIFLIARK